MDLMKLSKVIRDLNKDDNNIIYINVRTKEIEVYDINIYGIDVLEDIYGYQYFYVDGVKFYSYNYLKRGMDNVYLDRYVSGISDR